MKKFLATAAVAVALATPATASVVLPDAVIFFWDGSNSVQSSFQDSSGRVHTSEIYSAKGWKMHEVNGDPCVIAITEEVHDVVDIGGGVMRAKPAYFKTTQVDFRKMPQASAFAFTRSANYRNPVWYAKADVPDGAICESGKSCWTSWELWDNRGEDFLRRRLEALDLITTTSCKGVNP
jgi:hypothetical protein